MSLPKEVKVAIKTEVKAHFDKMVANKVTDKRILRSEYNKMLDGIKKTAIKVVTEAKEEANKNRLVVARGSTRAELLQAVMAARNAVKSTPSEKTPVAKARLTEPKLSPGETDAVLAKPKLSPEETDAVLAKQMEDLEIQRQENEERQAKYAEHCSALARQEKLEREQKRAEAEERRRAKEAAASLAAEAAVRAREEAAHAREVARQEKKHGKKRN